MEGARVRSVHRHGVTALVAEVDTHEIDPTREALLSHSHVLEEAVARATVLPMRFGMILPNEEALEDVVAANREELLDLLDRFDGMVELNVKTFFEDDHVFREIVSESPHIARLSSATRSVPDDATYYDRIRLGEMISEALTSKRETEARRIEERLGSLAIALQSEDVITEKMAANISFLVRRVDLDVFGTEVERLADEIQPRVRLRFVGPLPPYSFADMHLSAAV